jgi:putative SOS response-associated peptidase YedK
MCNYVANKPKGNTLLQRFTKAKIKIKNLEPNEGFFLNAFSNPNLHIITSEAPTEINVAKWGLVPSFIKDEKSAKEYSEYTLNAKAETVFDLPSWKHNINSHRCLIPVTAFYEWMHIGTGTKALKYPHLIKTNDTDVFTMGGIYDNWVDKFSGEVTTTFSIITVPANPFMAKIHNTKKRMPLIFRQENENDWLIPNLTGNDIKDLMQPLDEKYMVAHTIKRINPKLEVNEEMLLPFEYPELALYHA